MKKLLLAAFLGITMQAYAQETVQISSRASAVLPARAEIIPQSTGKAWISAIGGTDKLQGMAMTAMIPYDLLQQDSATIIRDYGNPGFADAMVEGMLGKLPGVSAMSRREITHQGRPGYDIEMEKDQPDSNFPYKRISAHIVFGGEGVYLLIVYLAEGQKADEQKAAFFHSLNIK